MRYLAWLLLIPALAFGQANQPATTLTGNPTSSIGPQQPVTVGGNLALSTAGLTTSQAINSQIGTSYAIATTDAGKLLTFSNSSAIAVSLSVATTTGFTAGFSFDVENLGAGLVTITPATSTINGVATLTLAANTGCTVTSDGANYQVSACTSLLKLTGTTSSIGGSSLLAGACSSGTVTVTGAATSNGVIATPVTYPGDGNYWLAYVSASNTVTVKICAAVADTPTASVYNVRIVP